VLIGISPGLLRVIVSCQPSAVWSVDPYGRIAIYCY